MVDFCLTLDKKEILKLSSSRGTMGGFLTRSFLIRSCAFAISSLLALSSPPSLLGNLIDDFPFPTIFLIVFSLSSSLKGVIPYNSSYSNTPYAHQSTALPWPSPRITSGAKYSWVPTNDVDLTLIGSADNSTERSKSESMTWPSSWMRTFSGFSRSGKTKIRLVLLKFEQVTTMAVIDEQTGVLISIEIGIKRWKKRMVKHTQHLFLHLSSLHLIFHFQILSINNLQGIQFIIMIIIIIIITFAPTTFFDLAQEYRPNVSTP
ncbi:hypothetical protein G2W53_000189 [Senna tora]|uniref:Uncharacterized protein n=1 Tax=Senna tora TaxID=362788 RepID=A0A835CI85_9FABA|nr:hypothetical protein G2W53_000189 [Senna tora]